MLSTVLEGTVPLIALDLFCRVFTIRLASSEFDDPFLVSELPTHLADEILPILLYSHEFHTSIHHVRGIHTLLAEVSCNLACLANDHLIGPVVEHLESYWAIVGDGLNLPRFYPGGIVQLELVVTDVSDEVYLLRPSLFTLGERA